MKLVIFDCDGTLVDSQHLIVEAMTRAFVARGHPLLPRDHVLSIVGLSLPIAVARLLPAVEEAEVLAVARAYRDAFGDLRRDPSHNEPLYPGIRGAVETLSAWPGAALGIATGKSRRGVATLLAREQMEGWFRTIQTADTHPSKPHPSMIRTAMAEAGAASRNTVMIGDTTFDIEMARSAGVGAIGVAWGYHPADALRTAGAHVVVDAADELIPAITALIAAEGAPA
jgi:phosphoglycolate phosphatase